MQRRGIPVKAGVWLYDGSVPSQVIVVHRDVRFGTGDYEDEDSVRGDVPGDTFEVLYAVASDPNQLAGGTSGGPCGSRRRLRPVSRMAARWLLFP